MADAAPTESFDYVIIGGGTAGLVLAARLTEDPQVEVLVLEAGEDLEADPRVNIPAMWMQLGGTSADWNFKTSAQDGLGGREMSFSQGHLLGGSSALNSMNFVVSAKSNIDQWAELGNTGWDESTISSALHKVYSLHGATNFSSADQGNGPIQANVPAEDSRWPELWRETIAASGFPEDNSPVSSTISGAVSYPDAVDPKTATRSYVCSAYLSPARDRSNLVVRTSVLVKKILFSSGNSSDPVASGVLYTTAAGEDEEVAARKELILSAGAINSPRILESSGVGDAALLKSLDIPVVVDNPYVGENLQNHLVVPLAFQTVAGEGLQTIDGLSRQDPAAVAAAMEAYAQQSGPLAKSNGNVMAHMPFPNIATDAGKQELGQLLSNYLQSSESGATKTTAAYDQALKSYVQSVLQSTTQASAFYITVPGWASYTPDGNSAAIPAGNETYFSIPVLLAHPLSRGSVHITSSNISSSSSGVGINPNYLAHPLDVEILARHVQFVEATLATTAPLVGALDQSAGAKRAPGMPAGPQGFAGDEGLVLARDYVRDKAVGAYHFIGTCSMLPREKGGVVDPQLRVYGVRNLRLVDASVIPLATSANSMATVYSLAERAAEIIKSGV